MPNELEIIANNIKVLDRRTRTHGNITNVRLGQADHLTFTNPGDYFTHLLSNSSQDLYKWNLPLQQWESLTDTGTGVGQPTLNWNHSFNRNANIERNIALFPNNGPYTITRGRVAIGAQNVNRNYNFMLVKQETGQPAVIEWTFNTVVDMTNGGGTLFIDVPLNFTATSNTRMSLTGFNAGGANFARGRFYVELEYN